MDLTPLFDLTGKVAVVTGGAGDIGRSYAEALGAAGAAVALADRDLAAATLAADDLAGQGLRVIAVETDVLSVESTQAMAATVVAELGGIDILINNAAIMTDLPPFGLTNMPVDSWDLVLNVNLRGPLLCTQAVIEAMEARGGGRIINGLSAGAFMAGGIYGVSKYALHGLTMNLASELGSRGINVNGIAPGLVASASGYVSLPEDSEFRDILGMQIPGKTSGPPADLVGTMLLLCSPAGDWINGQTISVDGGWIMRF